MDIIFSIVSSVLALVAIIISIVSLCFNAKITRGNTEFKIRCEIRQASEIVQDRNKEFICEYWKEGCTEESQEALKNALEESIINYLNTYEEACCLYLDGKVSKKRFKSTFYSEIGKLMTDAPDLYKKYLSNNTEYPNMNDVHIKWIKNKS